jgi:hypothetical protein
MVANDEQVLPKGRLKRFFRAHDRLISFVGAIIVFSTFVAKEEKQESTKLAMDSIESRVEFFNIRTEEFQTRDQLGKLLRVATSSEAKMVPKNTGGATEVDHLWRDDLYFSARRNVASAALLDAFDLFLAIPYTKNTEERMGRLEVTLNTIHQDDESIHRLIGEADTSSKTRSRDARKRFKQLVEQINHIEEGTEWWISSAESYRREVIDVSSGYKKDLENEYARYSHICTTLFVLGWGLGLTARIYNVEPGIEGME